MPYSLPLDAMPGTNEVLHKAAGDPKLAAQLIANPFKTLTDKGVRIPQDTKLKVKQVSPDDHEHLLYIPPKDLHMQLDALQKSLTEKYPNAVDEPYVQVTTSWWGVTFVLSDRATNDLRNGEAGIAAVAGILSGVLAIIPPPLNALALVPATLAAILTLASTALLSMNYGGKGIFVYAAWPLIWAPPCWIPWPR